MDENDAAHQVQHRRRNAIGRGEALAAAVVDRE